MTWTCDQVEARLSDYLEDVLPAPERAEFEAHVAECAECAPLVAGVRDVMAELRAMEEVDAPPRLVYSILDQTLGPREKVTGWNVFWQFIRGMATAKFAYGVASVMATVLLVITASGISLRKPKLADLYPANVYRNVDRQYHLTRARLVRNVSDWRVVYEIQSRLRQGESDFQSAPEETTPESAPKQKDDDHTHMQQKQQNRANQLDRQLEMLAAQWPVVLERSSR